MKKIFCFVLISLLSVSFLFSDGIVGVNVYFNFGWHSSKDIEISGGEVQSVDTNNIDCIISLDGANYFGSNHSFGIGYGLGLGLPIAINNINIDYSAVDEAKSIVPRLSFQYKYDVNDSLLLESGVGVLYNYKSNSTLNSKIFSFVADFCTLYRIQSWIGLKAGVALTLPISTSVSYKVPGTETVKKYYLDTFGVEFCPYFGFSYLY